MASTTLENSFISGLNTLKNAFVYRWGDQVWEDDMNKLKDVFNGNLGDVWKRTAKDRARGVAAIINTTIVLSLALETACTARNELASKTPVGSGDTGPRSTDTKIAPIKPMLIDGNFVGAEEIKKSCELKMGGSCEVFGIAFSNEKGIPKISPFVQHEGDNYVWGGSGRFDRLTQKTKDGKVVWTDDNDSIYFVGIPEDGSATELKILYYVDPDGKVSELPKPWGKVLASVVKPTPFPTETLTSTPTLAPTLTPSWTPTLAPSLTPIPPSATASRPTVIVQPTKPEVQVTPDPKLPSWMTNENNMSGIGWRVSDGSNPNEILYRTDLIPYSKAKKYLDALANYTGNTTRKYNPEIPECKVGDTCYIVNGDKNEPILVWKVKILP